MVGYTRCVLSHCVQPRTKESFPLLVERSRHWNVMVVIKLPT